MVLYILVKFHESISKGISYEADATTMKEMDVFYVQRAITEEVEKIRITVHKCMFCTSSLGFIVKIAQIVSELWNRHKTLRC